MSWGASTNKTSFNYLFINIQRYGALQITQKGETILKGEEEYFYRKIEFNTQIKEKKIKPVTIDADTLDDEKELFSALKSKRMELARKRRVPAYIIFPDDTLHQMLLHKPQTLEEMGIPKSFIEANSHLQDREIQRKWTMQNMENIDIDTEGGNTDITMSDQLKFLP